MTCYRKGGCGPYEMTSCSQCPYGKPQVEKRLAAYENTGLTPERHAELAAALFVSYQTVLDYLSGKARHSVLQGMDINKMEAQNEQV